MLIFLSVFLLLVRTWYPLGLSFICPFIMTVVCQNRSGRRGKIDGGCKSCVHLGRNGGSSWYLWCWCVWPKLTNNGLPRKSTSWNGKYPEPSSIGRGRLKEPLRIMNIPKDPWAWMFAASAKPWWLMFGAFIFKLQYYFCVLTASETIYRTRKRGP